MKKKAMKKAVKKTVGKKAAAKKAAPKPKPGKKAVGKPKPASDAQELRRLRAAGIHQTGVILELSDKVKRLSEANESLIQSQKFHFGKLADIVAIVHPGSQCSVADLIPGLPEQVADAVAVSNQMGTAIQELETILRPLEGEGLVAAAKRLSMDVLANIEMAHLNMDQIAKAAKGIAAKDPIRVPPKKEEDRGIRVPKDIKEMIEIVGEDEVWNAVRATLGMDQPQPEPKPKVKYSVIPPGEKVVVDNVVDETGAPVKVPGRRGRPKGSKNKPKPEVSPDAIAVATAVETNEPEAE